MPLDTAQIGVFGGSGFSSLLDDVEEVTVDTPWGPPSGPLHLGSVDGRAVAFLPRHGPGHRYPPHRINYRANVWAMREVGVTSIFAPCAAGSLDPLVRPGDLVVCDQLVDRTTGREQTFFDGPVTNHVSARLEWERLPKIGQAGSAATTGEADQDSFWLGVNYRF